MTVSNEEPTLVVTCKLSSAYRQAVAETVADRARIIFLDELDQPVARRAALSSATVLLTNNAIKELPEDERALIGNARLVQFLAAGLDFIPLDELPPQVPLASNAGAQAESMAEHALAMALAAAKRLPMEQARMAGGEFNQAGATRMLAESTCGILGLGGTGLALARLLKCLGACVHGINRRGESSVPIDWVGQPDALDAMLTVSDIVFVTVPLTRETFGIIGRRELGLMKEDAILVNLARGELVDEEALYLHLRDHGRFVACIDAWWVEPRHGRFEMQFPFLDLPNVIASPHNSAAGGNGRINGVKRAALNCLRALAGERPLHLISPDERAWHIGKHEPAARSGRPATNGG
ncbi:Phosphoglycerate dehydrogenase [Rhodospirillales bacterium URHD0017]|nr:Phosphoglycerate dehydrogenase [Rhodospirillales bacterium URHD0017]